MSKAEKLAEEKQKMRALAKEISILGISDDQRVFLIYVLSQELENVEHMQELSDHIRCLRPDLFLVGQVQSTTQSEQKNVDWLNVDRC